MATVVTASGLTPAGQTFSTLKTNVARYVLFPDDSECLDVSGQAINDALRKLNTRDWWYLLKYEDITPTSDSSTVTISSDYKASRKLEVLDPSSKARMALSYLDPKTFLSEYPERYTSGSPVAYTVINSAQNLQIELDCPVSSAFLTSYPTLRHYYYARHQMLSNDSDQISMPAEHELFVLWYAKWEVATYYDPSKVAVAMAEWRDIWQALVRDEARMQVADWGV